MSSAAPGCRLRPPHPGGRNPSRYLEFRRVAHVGVRVPAAPGGADWLRPAARREQHLCRAAATPAARRRTTSGRSPADAVRRVATSPAMPTESGDGDDKVLIDTHSTRVCDDVWALYRFTLDQNRSASDPDREWDRDLPELPVLHGRGGHRQAQGLCRRATTGAGVMALAALQRASFRRAVLETDVDDGECSRRARRCSVTFSTRRQRVRQTPDRAARRHRHAPARVPQHRAGQPG